MHITGRSLTSLLALPVLLAGFALAGCSGGSSISGSSATTAPTTASVDTLAPPVKEAASSVTVDAIDNDFQPKHLQIKVGTKVTFDNSGRNPHDVVPDDPKAFNFAIAPEAFQPGDKKSFTFDKPGTYAYYCSIHASATAGPMRGVITVTP